MNNKFPEDIISLSKLQINPGKVVSFAKDTHRPILLTSRGHGVAVLQSLEKYENKVDELAFSKAVVQGLIDIEKKNIMNLTEVKKLLRI